MTRQSSSLKFDKLIFHKDFIQLHAYDINYAFTCKKNCKNTCKYYCVAGIEYSKIWRLTETMFN